MVWSGTQWYDAPTTTSPPLNQWTHLAYVVNNGTAQVFVNGSRAYNGTGFPNVFTSTNATFALGVNYWDTPSVEQSMR